MAVQLPADQAKRLLDVPGVVAVQADQRNQPLTDSSPAFIGAPTIYDALGSSTEAGQGVIVGILDTGAWPEHPSFADPDQVLPAPRPRLDGTARVCDFGDNPLTPATDVFACNNKLIAGRPFLETYHEYNEGEVYPDSARDSNGHGTHTASTSAGSPVAKAETLGVDRGAIQGIAPGAHVAVYKVCGTEGCYSSDSADAVQQAIDDGVDVINFSISGGTDPYTDPVELAFLDAYAAGVFVATSAGNEGPGAGTVNHLSPWVTTVGASTQTRAFRSTLTVTGSGAPFVTTGASITAGAGPAPVVLASAAPYGRALCDAPAPAGSFAGKIVACQRGTNARVEKGFNVLQGGAVGMILYNPALADVETDNHWLPTVHLADGRDFVAYLTSNPGATAMFTAGTKAEGQGDVMAAFSSRGPAGTWMKPDVTAPGVEILAGHTPTPESNTGGPPGNYFQAIAGTSMSSPHVAGSAALLRALHPDWTPGQIKSALMTSAVTEVVKEDTTTPADPYDMGAGRIDLTRAGDPGVTFDVTARQFRQATDDVARIELNQPSVNVPTLPGTITTHRTATNVTGGTVRYRVSTTAPQGVRITARPQVFALRKGQSVELTITIDAVGVPVDPKKPLFGRIQLDEIGARNRDAHLPVAFTRGPAAVTLTSSCDPTTITLRPLTESTCAVTAANQGAAPVTVDLRSSVSKRLRISSVTGASRDGTTAVTLRQVQLAGSRPGDPSIATGNSPRGFSALSVAPEQIEDEEILNFDVPEFTFNAEKYTRIGVTSNGYAVVGGGDAQDVELDPPGIPDVARPNNVLAPFWTDLDGTGAPGVAAALVTAGANRWLVFQWQVNVWGTTSQRAFQLWIGLNGSEDISFAYDPANLPADPNGQTLVVGVENSDGSGGEQIDGPPTGDLRVTGGTPTPGDTATYSFTVQGATVGQGRVTSTLDSKSIPGTTVETETIKVVRRAG
jgi:subtilisin family serine protease